MSFLSITFHKLNQTNMRRLFILIFISICGICSCTTKTINEKDLSVHVDTYNYDSLDYPSESIQIPDSSRIEFIEKFFAPWELNPEALLANIDSFPGKSLSYLNKYLANDEWYGENKKPHKKWLKEGIVNNINTSSFPNFIQKGIIKTHTNVRRIPSNKPGFNIYSNAGEGFPFDYFQETGIWANTPILIVHISEDKQWCYAITPYYKGWISMHAVAIVNQDFMNQWLTGNYCLPLSDSLNLNNELSSYAINAKMGMVLPYEKISDDTSSISVFYTNSDENQNAKVLKAEVKRELVAFEDLSFNETELKSLVSNLIGRPYGWGGSLENRDCSSMIRDLLGTYRIWLPRDSKDQINAGNKYDLPSTNDEKIKFIKENGIPFLTILRKKGHNMLYVGIDSNGDPLILHAIWGLTTFYSNQELAAMLKNYPIEGLHQDKEGKLNGRYIIGEAVVTSVNAGIGNDNITYPLVEYMYSMTNILEK